MCVKLEDKALFYIWNDVCHIYIIKDKIIVQLASVGLAQAHINCNQWMNKEQTSPWGSGKTRNDGNGTRNENGNTKYYKKNAYHSC